MSDKFQQLKKEFRRLYDLGATHEAIAEKLGISFPTVSIWRRKMGLPSRRNTGPVSWMDERRVHGRSPRDILESISKEFGFTRNEIPYVLTRFDKLRGMGYLQGRDALGLILTAAYLYLNWEGSGRQPCSALEFARRCHPHGYRISRTSLLRSSRFYKDAGLFPAPPLGPQRLLERKWNLLRTKYGLPEDLKAAAIRLISLPRFSQGRSPQAVVAASLYISAIGLGVHVSQFDLSLELGTTEMSLRNVKEELEERMRQENEGENHELEQSGNADSDSGKADSSERGV